MALGKGVVIKGSHKKVNVRRWLNPGHHPTIRSRTDKVRSIKDILDDRSTTLYRVDMASLNATEIRRIEKQFSAGIKSGAVVDVFRAKGHRFSEATLRKYVQLGLLPKSRRVGARGRHRGSSGLYPVSIVRLVNEIKRALDDGATLEDVRFGYVALTGGIDVSRRACEEALQHFRESILRINDDKQRAVLGRGLVAQRRVLVESFRELDKLAVRIGRRRA